METLPELLIDTPLLKKGALQLRAINNPLRQQILKLIFQHSRMRVTDIHRGLKKDQPTVSTHLNILRRAKLVIATREGKFVYYSVNESRIVALHLMSTKLLDA